MVGRFSRSVAVASLVFLSIVWSSSVSAAIKPVGQVILTNGPFIAIQSDKSSRSLTRGSEFYQGDRLWTGPRTKAQVRFSDGAIMTLRPDTEFTVDEYEFDSKNAGRNKSLFTLIKGGFRTLTGLISRLQPDGYKVKTAYAIVGVRGTTYETVIDSGLYAAAWQGTIYVENEKKLLELGFGQEFNYARVTSPNSAPAGLLEVPPQLQETIDPGLREAVVDPTLTRLTTGLLQDGVDARLTAAEVASLTQFGMATIPASRSGLSGPATDGSTGSPIIFGTATNTVLREGGTGALLVTNTSIPTVAWGAWNGGLLQPDPQNASATVSISSPVFWVTMQPVTSIPTGSFNYGGSLFSGAGTDSVVGAMGVASFFAAVDFGTGSLNGTMAVQDSPITKTWSMSFAGNVTGATFNANASGSVTGGGSTAGNLTGAFSGSSAQSMGGVFEFQENVNPSNFVNGVFAASR